MAFGRSSGGGRGALNRATSFWRGAGFTGGGRGRTDFWRQAGFVGHGLPGLKPDQQRMKPWYRSGPRDTGDAWAKFKAERFNPELKYSPDFKAGRHSADPLKARVQTTETRMQKGGPQLLSTFEHTKANVKNVFKRKDIKSRARRYQRGIL